MKQNILNLEKLFLTCDIKLLLILTLMLPDSLLDELHIQSVHYDKILKRANDFRESISCLKRARMGHGNESTVEYYVMRNNKKVTIGWVGHSEYIKGEPVYADYGNIIVQM